MKTKQKESVDQMWQDFVQAHPEHQGKGQPASWYFCDNEKDADECAELVVQGIKRATSTSLWWHEKNQEDLPRPGDLAIVTDWAGWAKAVIETTQVDQVPYREVTEEYAQIEGEGGGSLDYWKRVHWAYYSREMAPHQEVPTEDMVIVCEQFKTVWK